MTRPPVSAPRKYPLVESLEPRALLANVSAGFSDSVYVSGLTRPSAMAFAPDGRLFVSEQDGKVRIIKNGQLLSTPALKLTVSKAGERGVQSEIFDPDFANNHFMYLYYTAVSPAHNRLSRFTVTGDTIDPSSEHVLLDLEPLNAVYHNSGALHFGEDGKLYISVGENTRATPAQSLDSLLGKILRMNPDGSIPTDNPFYNVATGQNRLIYSMGLRNPFTFAIQPGTGTLFINDVGQDTWEEVNKGGAGANFGWPQSQGPTTDPRFVSPIHSYNHSTGGCAVVGGAFYPSSGGTFPSTFAGKYLFADHCLGYIKALDPSTGAIVGTISKGAITANADLDVGPDGALYYLERTFDATGGRVGRIQANGVDQTPPSITSQPGSITVAQGSMVSFTVGATGAGPFTYQWQKDTVNISGATAATYKITSALSADSGQKFRCVVTNAFGTATSNAATLVVTVNQAPIATIDLPDPALTYRAGDTITFSGTATDPQDGNVPASKFTWQVDFHHDTHLHPFVSPFNGAKSGTFIVPRDGEASSNTWYEILLTVKDVDGNVTSLTRDIFPKKSKVTVTSNVPGLTLLLDAEPKVSPIGFTGVERFHREISAPTTQAFNGKSYIFDGWSDGGAATHTISTPTANTTYIATYHEDTAAALHGLTAHYFNNRNFTGTEVTRVDPVINFDWEDGSPDALITRDTFSARWTGKLKAKFTQKYTFSATVNDGVRLWINNTLIIDAWVSNGEKTYTGHINLVAGTKYDVRMDFYEDTKFASAQLMWSSTSQARDIIPESAFFI